MESQTSRVALRDLCVERFAFFHVLAAIAAAREGMSNEYAWSGSVREGRYWAGDGNETWAAAWDATALVAIAQGVEGPLRADLFRGAPPDVRPLATSLQGWWESRYPDDPSSSLWVARHGEHEAVGSDRHPDRFAVLTTERRAAFLGIGPHPINLQEFFGLEEDALWVAERLSSLLMASSHVVLTRAERDELLTSPEDDPRSVQARRMFEQLGLSFPA